MNHEEEQQQELEVLESIYPEELLRGESGYSIELRLDTQSLRTHTVTLHVQYPEQYPEEVPQLRISAEYEDGEEEVVGVKEQELTRADVAQLLAKLEDEADASVGFPMVYALVSLLKDEAEQTLQEKAQAAQRHHEQRLLAQEREEQKKFHGTKVTPESFAEWRAKFRKEMALEERDAQRMAAIHNGKMTGREIWEKGLATEYEAGA